MSSTLSTLRSKTDFYLGAENIYQADDKTTALNSARNHLLLNYEISEFIVTETLTFASGVATIPTTYLRGLKLFTTAQPTDFYIRYGENEFDQDIDNTWTIKDDSGTRKIFISPSSITTGTTLRFIKKPADMSADGDESGFNTYWDDAHSALAAWWLLNNDRQPAAQATLETAKELIQSAMRHQDTESNESPDLVTWFDDIRMFKEEG